MAHKQVLFGGVVVARMPDCEGLASDREASALLPHLLGCTLVNKLAPRRTRTTRIAFHRLQESEKLGASFSS